MLFCFFLGWFHRFLTFRSWLGYVYTIPDSFRADMKKKKKKTNSAEQNRTERHRTTAQRPGFSNRAGSRQTEFASAGFHVNSPPTFFGNYPDLKRAFMSVLSLRKRAKNVLMSVFCSKSLIFAPECWKCILRGPEFKLFPRAPLPRVYSLSTHSKLFATHIKSY